jgi:hypothetical protein
MLLLACLNASLFHDATITSRSREEMKRREEEKRQFQEDLLRLSARVSACPSSLAWRSVLAA